jgi:hypothetical protein
MPHFDSIYNFIILYYVNQYFNMAIFGYAAQIIIMDTDRLANSISNLYS